MAKQLIMAASLYPLVVSEEKRITVREGFRDFEPGETIQIVNAEDSTQRVECEVRYVLKFLKATMVPRLYLEMDGFTGYVDFIETLKQFYPDFSRSSPVTVIYWRVNHG